MGKVRKPSRNDTKLTTRFRMETEVSFVRIMKLMECRFGGL